MADWYDSKKCFLLLKRNFLCFTLSCHWVPQTGVWLSFLYALPSGICTNRWDLPEPSLFQADQIEQSQPFFFFSVWCASAPISPLWLCAGLTWVGPCLSSNGERSHGHSTSDVALVLSREGGSLFLDHPAMLLFLQPRIPLSAFASNNNQREHFKWFWFQTTRKPKQKWKKNT